MIETERRVHGLPERRQVHPAPVRGAPGPWSPDPGGWRAIAEARLPAHERRARQTAGRHSRPVALGNESVRIGGAIVGRVSSGGCGFAVERSIVYAYLRPDVPVGARGEIDVFGEWVGCEVVRAGAQHGGRGQS